MSQYFLNSLQFDTAKIRHQASLKKLSRELFEGKREILQLSSDQVDEEIVSKLEKYLGQGSVPENLEYFAAQFPNLKISFDDVKTVQGMVLEIHKHSHEIRKMLAASSDCQA